MLLLCRHAGPTLLLNVAGEANLMTAMSLSWGAVIP